MSEGKRRITMADIAKACGVSSMTVSLALRNNPKISDKTRIKILKKAEELGYTPDPILAALNQYRKNSKNKAVQSTIAWINPFRDPDRQYTFKEFELYWKGASESAKKHGYRLEEFCTTEISFQRMETIFKTRNIKGLLIAQLGARRYIDENADWHSFPWQDYAAVRFGRNRSYPELHYVSSAQARNTITAFEKIRSKGYQRIGFVGLHNKWRVFSMGAWFAQIDISNDWKIPSLLYTLEHSPKQKQDMLQDWLQKYKPDAVLTGIAELPEMLKALNIDVPGDIALATTTVTDTPIDAGIDQNPEEIGRAAVRMIIGLINEQNFGIPEIKNETLIEGKWVDGSMLPSKK